MTADDSRQAGAMTRSGGDLTSGRAAGTGAPEPPARTTHGPCPECGHHGPRYVLCLDPDCRHEVSQHDIRKDGSRGACLSAGTRGDRCPCKALVITELTTKDPS